MNEQAFAITITQKAREVFSQPSLEFSPSQVFREIPGFDSVLAIKYILEIEKAFGITLNEEEVDNMHTMGDLMRMLLSQKGP